MATTEKPPSRIDGKPNPAYTKWYREQKKPAAEAEVQPPESPVQSSVEIAKSTALAASHAAFTEAALEGKFGVDNALRAAGFTEAQIEDEDFQSAAEPEQTTNDDPREPEVAPALEALSLKVIALARNNAFVYCGHNGERVAVVVKKGSGPKLIGKAIPVAWDADAGNYVHTP